MNAGRRNWLALVEEAIRKASEEDIYPDKLADKLEQEKSALESILEEEEEAYENMRNPEKIDESDEAQNNIAGAIDYLDEAITMLREYDAEEDNPEYDMDDILQNVEDAIASVSDAQA